MRIRTAILGCSAALVMTAGLAGTAAADGDAPSPKPTLGVCKPTTKPSRCSPPAVTPAPARPGQPTYTG